MFLHIGGDVVVALQDVVAIVDARTVQQGGAGDTFSSVAKADALRLAGSEGEPSAYVVTKDAVYASTISPSTLRRRAASPYTVREEGENDGSPTSPNINPI